MMGNREMSRDLILNYIKGLNQCLEEVLQQDIDKIADIIFDAYKNDKEIFVMGNGGSATTASHFVQGLFAVNSKERLRVCGLTDNVAVITSLANDIDYFSVFEKQLVGQVNQGDVVIGISASGNSPNILKAIGFAQINGAVTIGFIGFGGGKLKGLADESIVLSSKDYGQVEDAHLCLAHIVCCLVKEKIANG